MASGWSKDGDVQEQIDASIKDAIKNARRHLPSGPGLKDCGDCGNAIPEARRQALPGVRLCVTCQAEADKELKNHNLYNRRGSKDSQLR